LFAFLAVILQWLVWRKYFEWRIWASLVPIVGGILLTSVTELSFNMFGFCAALFGCLATSTKTILAESLLHGYKFDRFLLLSILLLFYLRYLYWSKWCTQVMLKQRIKKIRNLSKLLCVADKLKKLRTIFSSKPVAAMTSGIRYCEGENYCRHLPIKVPSISALVS
jgi:Triose-phosphate Transporter family